MTVNEYIVLCKKIEETRHDIGNYINGADLEIYGNLESLLKDTDESLCYLAIFVNKLLSKVDLENIISGEK